MTRSPSLRSLAEIDSTTPFRKTQADFDWNSSSSLMARREPAAVRSLIQSPSLISQVTMQPAIGTPCLPDEVIANVSSTSMLSLRSLAHTFQARLAIGHAFHSIRGILRPTTTGLALKAISSDSVGSASGERFDTAGGVGLALAWAGTVCEFATSNFRSARLTF